MPLIGDVDKFMAGGTTVTALYAGAVKVWPLGPPQPDGTAHWVGGGSSALEIVVDGINGYTPGRYVIAVDGNPPASGHPGWTLGFAGVLTESTMRWGSPTSTAVRITTTPPRMWTNAEAVAEWAGHLVAFTVNNTRTVTAVEVLDAPPPPPPPSVHAQDDASSRMMIWDDYWAGIDAQPRPIEVVCSPVFRTLPATNRITVIDAASVDHYVTWGKGGPMVDAGHWITVADTGGYWIARNGSVVGVEYYLTPMRP
jgi:hypothetical protein